MPYSGNLFQIWISVSPEILILVHIEPSKFQQLILFDEKQKAFMKLNQPTKNYTSIGFIFDICKCYA
jgi:hypothetical protein